MQLPGFNQLFAEADEAHPGVSVVAAGGADETVLRALGMPWPRLAVLAASEKPTESLPDTLEAAELQRRGEADAWPGCTVQGPLSFDLAYAAQSSQRKGVAGPVAGKADVMLLPDLS